MSFRFVPKSVTLNDLERRNGRYFALFEPVCVAAALKPVVMSAVRATIAASSSCMINRNSSGDEIANVNFYAVRPEATRIR